MLLNLSSLSGSFDYAEQTYGQSSIGAFQIIANNVEPQKDANYNIGNETNLRATFFIGGEEFGTRATVPEDRLLEFREMVLKLKPAQTVAAFVIVDFVSNTDRIFRSGADRTFLDGTPRNFLYE